jgi:four helix bundle protein
MSEESSAMAPDDGRSDDLSLPSYQRLTAWQKSMELVKAIYRATSDWPRQEQFGLTNQVRRAAVSIPSNIAEGHGRSSSQEYAHHLSIAYGSLCELETQLLIAEGLGYSHLHVTKHLLGLVAEVRRLLLALSALSPLSSLSSL